MRKPTLHIPFTSPIPLCAFAALAFACGPTAPGSGDDATPPAATATPSIATPTAEPATATPPCGDASTEVCNGLDDDCDGAVDEGTWYLDADGDGHGDPDNPQPAGSTFVCETQGWVFDLGDDCDDNDPLIYGGAEEAPDWVDNDCDAAVDEGLGFPFGDFAFARAGASTGAIDGGAVYRDVGTLFVATGAWALLTGDDSSCLQDYAFTASPHPVGSYASVDYASCVGCDVFVLIKADLKRESEACATSMRANSPPLTDATFLWGFRSRANLGLPEAWADLTIDADVIGALYVLPEGDEAFVSTYALSPAQTDYPGTQWRMDDRPVYRSYGSATAVTEETRVVEVCEDTDDDGEEECRNENQTVAISSFVLPHTAYTLNLGSTVGLEPGSYGCGDIALIPSLTLTAENIEGFPPLAGIATEELRWDVDSACAQGAGGALSITIDPSEGGEIGGMVAMTLTQTASGQGHEPIEVRAEFRGMLAFQ